MNPSDAFLLEGRVALISGGGGMIGAALAEALAAAGARVAAADIDEQRAEETAGRIRAFGGDAAAYPADATQEAQAERVVAATLARFGRLDIIVNAVGGGAAKAMFNAEDYPRDKWDWIMELNLRSTVIATQPAVRAMIAAGQGGRVINMSSVRGQLGVHLGYSAYVAAKGAISALTRQWATEWGKHRITVNALAPTYVETPEVATLLSDPQLKEAVLSRIPLGRIGQTSDLAGAVIFLASEASSFITGAILSVDGGLTATQ